MLGVGEAAEQDEAQLFADEGPAGAAAPALAAARWHVQIASTSAQRITGGIVIARKYSATSVRIVLKTLLNRLARSQPTIPWVRGGGVARHRQVRAR